MRCWSFAATTCGSGACASHGTCCYRSAATSASIWRVAVVEHERAVARLRQEAVVNECAEHFVARHFVEAPQAPRLLGSQPQSGHLEELTAHAADDILQALRFWHQSAGSGGVERAIHIHTWCQRRSPRQIETFAEGDSDLCSKSRRHAARNDSRGCA